MAVQSEGSNRQQTTMGNAFTAAQDNKQQQQSHSTTSSAFSGGNGGGAFGFGGVSLTPGVVAYAPIRNAMGSDSYQKLAKNMREFVKSFNKNPSLDIKVLELDRNENPDLHFACFVFAVQSTTKPQYGVGYNIVLMEATGAPLGDRTETINNVPVSTPIYAEEALNSLLDQAAKDLLGRVYGPDLPLFALPSSVIPADFDYENEAAYEQLASIATTAATAPLVMFANGGSEFSDLNLVTELKNRKGDNGDADLSFIYDFRNQKTIDLLGLPTRASVVIQGATGYRRNNRVSQINSGSGPKIISEATGFVELVPVAPRFAQPQYGMPYPTQMPTQRLAPVLILNQMKTNFAFTPGAMITNVLIASDLHRGFGWVTAFQNKVGSQVGGVDLTDVTAITIDMPSRLDPTRPEEKPKVPVGGLDTQSLMTFLGMYCQPDLHIGMDIPVASHDSWYMNVFEQAAKNNPQAIAAIIEAIETLSNGNFKKILPPGTKMFLNQPMAIERGFWPDDKNGRRDTAEVDYVAVCAYAYANNNPALVERYTNTFLQLSTSQAVRLQERREIIQTIVGRNVTFYGRSIRVIWNGQFLAYALQALSNAGITTTAEGRGVFDFSGNRANADFLTGGGMPAGAGWNTAMGNVAQGASWGGGYTSWGRSGV